MKLRTMQSSPNQSAFYNPRWGLLIPSPLTTHTHAVACHPFDPNALLTVEGRIRYLPEHAINDLPLEQQATHSAGQVIVAREMAKLRHVEVQARRFQSFPELELSIHGNPHAKPLADVAYWRKMLGWAGAEKDHARNQFHQYTTLLPGMSRLLKGVQDRSVWDHKTGEWKTTTQSAVQEAKKRRDWVCTELERIDTLRYEVMADWKQKTEEGYLADRHKDEDKKRKRDQDNDVTTSRISPPGEESDEDHDDTLAFKRPRITADASIERTAKHPRLSIEPPFDFSPPEPQIPESQTTLSSLSTSPDFDHDTRSQAPEPESPVKAFMTSSDNEESIHRYTFVLDIPTTDNQRVEWLKFLDKYHWNPAMISALRRFFCAEPSPNTSMTKKFLERLWEVAGSIKAVDDEGVESEQRKGQGQGAGKGGEDKEKQHRLFWDRKVKALVDEVAVLATPMRENDTGGSGRVLRRQHANTQPTWLSTPSVSPLSSVGMPTPKRSGASALTVSPSNGRMRVLGLPVAGFERRGNLDTADDNDPDIRGAKKLDIPALMKLYVTTLSSGDKVEVPCDKCRALSLECRINQSSCRRCARRHDRCVWNEVKVGEVRALGLLGGRKREGEREVEGESEMDEDEDEVQKSGRKRGRESGRATKLLRSSGGRFAFTGGRRVRRKSVYDFPEDSDETLGFLENKESDGGNDTGENEDTRAMGDGDQTRVFLDCGRVEIGGAMDVDSTDEDVEVEEEEWIPSS